MNTKDFCINIPETIFTNIEYELTITSRYVNNDSTLLFKINNKEEYLIFQEGEAHFPYTFHSGQNLTFSHENYTESFAPRPIPLWLSILPPLIAILIALAFREVYSALFAGLITGTAIIALYINPSVGSFFTGLFNVLDTYVLESLSDKDHLSIIIFSMLIGATVGVVTKNGGMQGVVNFLSRYARSPRSGQLVTWALGIAIFFDDYANTLVVGNTMKSVTDKLRISREKLAYIVDSTAAPVAAMAFITTWIGAELGYIENAIGGITEIKDNEGVYSIFLNSLQYSFYPLFTLAFMLILIWKKRDYGPMFKAEVRSRKTGIAGNLASSSRDNDASEELDEFTPENGIKIRGINAVLPILTIIGGTIWGLFYTGTNSCYDQLTDLNIYPESNSFFTVWGNLELLPKHPSGFIEKLGSIIGSSNSYAALLWASLSGLILAVLLTLIQRIMTLQQTMDAAIKGFKTMFNAMLILILAWSLAMLTEDMHTADFLTGIMGDSFAPWTIPAISFLLAALVAFATGSSWGTMAILYPLVLPAAWKVCQLGGYDFDQSMLIFYNVVSTVLAGSVMGDHCSPISDTTILSSLASSCNHIDHVKTQLPYALTVGFVAVLFGTIPAAFGIPTYILIPFGIGLLFLLVHFIGKKTDP